MLILYCNTSLFVTFVISFSERITFSFLIGKNMSFHNLAEPAIYLVVLTMKEALFAANYSTVL